MKFFTVFIVHTLYVMYIVNFPYERAIIGIKRIGTVERSINGLEEQREGLTDWKNREKD